MYIGEDDASAFDLATKIALDWIEANPPEGSESDVAWGNKAVGDRVPYLAYLLRIGASTGELREEDAVCLLESAIVHGRWLTDDENYAYLGNHGLSQDEGLLLLANYLNFLPEADSWRVHAVDRLKSNLNRRTHLGEGIYLEHSTRYHAVAVNFLRRIDAHTPLHDPELDRLLTRMVDAAGWFVMPDEQLAQVGDTPLRPVADWARRSAAGKRGLKVFPETGWAVVKLEDSYLITSATCFGQQHKHADELSFELFEGGERVIQDGGLYAYADADPYRRYALSAEAHSTLIVDGEGFRWQKGAEYGSGIRGAGEGDGWFVILGTNPLLGLQGVSHNRLFLYKPSLVLIVIDEVRAERAHTVQRLFQIGANLEVRNELERPRVTLTGDGFSGTLADWPPGAASRRIAKGQVEPEISGWTFPGSGGERLPRPTVEYSSQHRDAILGCVLELRPLKLELRSVKHGADGWEVSIGIDGEPVQVVVDETPASLAVIERTAESAARP